MFPQFKLFYNGEEIDQITPQEEKELSTIMTAKGRPASIRWKGDTLETRKLIIRRKTETQSVVNENNNTYLKEWHERQEVLKEQTPGEKTFRNFKCMFTWKYLLQYGFTRFFGTEDWKKEMPYDTFRRFDNLISEREPKMMEKFMETLEKYFTDNPEKIWCDKKIMERFLPKGNILSRSDLIKSIPK